MRSLVETLEEYGWVKGRLKGPDGVCLDGAVRYALGFITNCALVPSAAYEEYRAATQLLATITKEETGDRDFVRFNDCETTSYEDVILLAKKFDERMGL